LLCSSSIKSNQIKSNQIYFEAQNMKETRQMKNYKCGPMPNVMAALPNTGGALCSTPQFG